MFWMSLSDVVNEKIGKIEGDMRRLDRLENSVGMIDNLYKDVRVSHKLATEALDQIGKVDQKLPTIVKSVEVVKTTLDEALRTVEAEGKLKKDTMSTITSLQREVTNASTIANGAKLSAEEISRKVEKLGNIKAINGKITITAYF